MGNIEAAKEAGLSAQPELISEPQAAPEDQAADDIAKTVPEGSFVLNEKAVDIAGEDYIRKIVKDAIKIHRRGGNEIEKVRGLSEKEAVDILISNGEFIIPPELVGIIGEKQLKLINDRGIAVMKKEEQLEQSIYKGKDSKVGQYGGPEGQAHGGLQSNLSELESSKREFINNAHAVVSEVNKNNMVPTPVILSIIAQETGWGTSRFVKDANNWFNITTDKPDQKFVPAKDRPTHKVRSFDAGSESVSAFLEMVNTKPHYEKVRNTLTEYKKGNASEHDIIDAISDTGYAEDPNWANNVKSIHDKRIKDMFTKMPPKKTILNTTPTEEYVSGDKVKGKKTVSAIAQKNSE
jgi:hypothetical protein